MDKKFRVYNDRHYDVGVLLLNGQDRNIKPGSFVMLSQDDIDFIESQCTFNQKLFGTGVLRIDKVKEEELEDMGIFKAEENFYEPMEDIQKKLRGNTQSLKKWLDSITDKPLLAEIYKVAKDADLSASKMRVIEESLPELLTAKYDE